MERFIEIFQFNPRFSKLSRITAVARLDHLTLLSPCFCLKGELEYHPASHAPEARRSSAHRGRTIQVATLVPNQIVELGRCTIRPWKLCSTVSLPAFVNSNTPFRQRKGRPGKSYRRDCPRCPWSKAQEATPHRYREIQGNDTTPFLSRWCRIRIPFHSRC
jgi:hypothetical protein